MAKDHTPEWMITYWCPHCSMDSGRTEIDGPYCYFCERTGDLVEMKREKLTREVMFNRIKLSTDRMMDNLRKAHGIHEKEWPQDEQEEMMLLEALAKGQDLREAIQKMAKCKTSKKSH